MISYISLLFFLLLEFVFTASGREDIDVKCLGDGRPFILEFFEPKRTEFTKQELKHYQKVYFFR
jgi:tRNA pseudouridine synthase 10